MSEGDEFVIDRFHFNSQLPGRLVDFDYAQNLWPVVYILNDDPVHEAYIGETTDAISRFKTHLKHTKKGVLSSVYLICSDKFYKSATLDLEANLIKYISGDGKYLLLNDNFGLRSEEHTSELQSLMRISYA